MNQDQPELTLEESVKQVMQTLPPVIRDYLSQGKYTPVARSLMAKYALRIDQGGVLEREIMLLLMGIENPDEFSKALAEEAKLDQQTVNGIMQDVNTQIFIPLREEMRKEPPTAAEAPKPPVAPAPLAPQVPSATTPRVLVPAMPVRKPALRDVLESVMKAPTAPPAPSASSQRAVPSPNLPGVMSEVRPSPAILKVEPQMPSPAVPIAPAPESRTQPPKPSAPAAPAKPYSVDPYREPLDEK